MELIKIASEYSGWEIAIGIISLVMWIVASLVVINWYTVNKKQLCYKIITTIILICLGLSGFIINTNIPNYTIYTYHVTDMEQLADAIDDGYVVVYSDANIYQIRKQN